MREFIAEETRNDAGRYLKVEKELIRCRDCRYYRAIHSAVKKAYEYDGVCEHSHGCVGADSDGYCNHAELMYAGMPERLTDATTGRADASAAVRLCHCNECIHGAVTAVLEKKDGDIKQFYMCKHWLAPTAEDGYCHQGRFKDVQKTS